MRRALLLLWCSSLFAADPEQLAQLNRNRRFFELRRALDQTGSDGQATLFYRGVIACRFGHEKEGIDLLRRILAGNPSGPMARQAYEELAGAYERLTRYKDAAQAWAEWLRLTPKDDPERESNANTQSLMESLSDVAPESLLFGVNVPIRATRNHIGTWNVPVQVNGVKGNWIFDSGANQSVVSQSEAKRMGLAIHESKAWGGGSTGYRNPLQIAVADTLQFGGTQIHNVVLLVLSDDALNIKPAHYRIDGVLGLPVLRDLGRVGIAKSGEVLFRPAPSSSGAPNLWFDELDPMLEIDHNQHPLQMFIDTGANASVLYPSFRNALRNDEQSHLRNKREKTAGAGLAIQRKVAVIPRLTIDLPGQSVDLKKISLLPEAPSGSGHYRDGVIGMDALWNGFLFDFSAMRVEPLP